MGGPGGRPPPHIDQNLGLVMAARVRHGGKISLKSLTFGHFLYKNVPKAFSFRGASPPDSLRSPWSPPPLANPGSATGLHAYIVCLER